MKWIQIHFNNNHSPINDLHSINLKSSNNLITITTMKLKHITQQFYEGTKNETPNIYKDNLLN